MVETQEEKIKFTQMEINILKYAARGMTRDETAKALYVCPATVGYRARTRIFRRLGAKNMNNAIWIASKRGLI